MANVRLTEFARFEIANRTGLSIINVPGTAEPFETQDRLTDRAVVLRCEKTETLQRVQLLARLPLDRPIVIMLLDWAAPGRGRAIIGYLRYSEADGLIVINSRTEVEGDDIPRMIDPNTVLALGILFGRIGESVTITSTRTVRDRPKYDSVHIRKVARYIVRFEVEPAIMAMEQRGRDQEYHLDRPTRVVEVEGHHVGIAELRPIRNTPNIYENGDELIVLEPNAPRRSTITAMPIERNPDRRVRIWRIRNLMAEPGFGAIQRHLSPQLAGAWWPDIDAALRFMVDTGDAPGEARTIPRSVTQCFTNAGECHFCDFYLAPVDRGTHLRRVHGRTQIPFDVVPAAEYIPIVDDTTDSDGDSLDL